MGREAFEADDSATGDAMDRRVRPRRRQDRGESEGAPQRHSIGHRVDGAGRVPAFRAILFCGREGGFLEFAIAFGIGIANELEADTDTDRYAAFLILLQEALILPPPFVRCASRLAASLSLLDEIPPRDGKKPLVLVDAEHFRAQLFERVVAEGRFDPLIPQPRQQAPYRKLEALDPTLFTPRWAGYATAVRPYRFQHSLVPIHQLIQRCGETPADYCYKAFLSTRKDDEPSLLTRDYPERWGIEGFFNTDRRIGWNRAGTLNLNIRDGQMTMALLAQAALQQLRQRLPEPLQTWDASHLPRDFLDGLEGDVRAHDDTIVVTYHNATHAESLRSAHESISGRLEKKNVNPRVPWLYDFKLDFRFR